MAQAKRILIVGGAAELGRDRLERAATSEGEALECLIARTVTDLRRLLPEGRYDAAVLADEPTSETAVYLKLAAAARALPVLDVLSGGGDLATALRVSGLISDPAGQEDVVCFRLGPYVLDRKNQEVREANGKPIRLTQGEFALLEVLARYAMKPVHRDTLMEETRGREWTPFDRSLDVLMGRLRKKLERDPKRPDLIKTARGVGYMLAVPVMPLREPL